VVWWLACPQALAARHQLGDIRLTHAPRQSSSAEQLAAKNGYELAKFFC
jgi:hypothetical protein